MDYGQDNSCQWLFFNGSVSKRDTGDMGLFPKSGRSPGGENGNPFQYSCLKNPKNREALASYTPWSCKEQDTAEQLSTDTVAVSTTSRAVVWSEVSQKEKNKYSILTYIYGIWKNGTDEPIFREGIEMQMQRMYLWIQWGIE